MVRFITGILLILFFSGCRNDYSPKPRGYFRIDVPEKEYKEFDSIYPYSFDIPVYSRFIADTGKNSEPYWGNLVFPEFGAIVYLSYKKVGSTRELIEYSEDARTFVNKHIPKATAIIPQEIRIPEKDVSGILYEIRGSEAASPVQFWVTDSTDHFLRGALYFNVAPNNDSLAPVIDFIRADIKHMISTIDWERISGR